MKCTYCKKDRGHGGVGWSTVTGTGVHACLRTTLCEKAHVKAFKRDQAERRRAWVKYAVYVGRCAGCGCTRDSPVFDDEWDVDTKDCDVCKRCQPREAFDEAERCRNRYRRPSKTHMSALPDYTEPPIIIDARVARTRADALASLLLRVAAETKGHAPHNVDPADSRACVLCGLRDAYDAYAACVKP